MLKATLVTVASLSLGIIIIISIALTSYYIHPDIAFGLIYVWIFALLAGVASYLLEKK